MTENNPTRYVSHTETNKLIRAELKATFPGIKFSVRAGSGGGSTRITWTDGPAEATVEKVVGNYAGSQTDYTGDYTDPRTTTDAQGNPVHYGAGYIFTSRLLSPEMKAEGEMHAAKLMGIDHVNPEVSYTDDTANLHHVEQFIGFRIGNGWTFGDVIVRHVAGRLAELAYHGHDAQRVVEDRQRHADLEAATYKNVLEGTRSREAAQKAVHDLNDPLPPQGAFMDAETYAAQVSRKAAENAEDEEAAARLLLGDLLDSFDPLYGRAFDHLDAAHGL